MCQPNYAVICIKFDAKWKIGFHQAGDRKTELLNSYGTNSLIPSRSELGEPEVRLEEVWGGIHEDAVAVCKICTNWPDRSQHI
jgi:hypothetical protein